MKLDIRKMWNQLKWKRKNNNVQDLFIERAKAFTANTAKILVNMEGVMSAIHDYMGFQAAFAQGAVLEWREVSLIGKDDNGLVAMTGVLTYPPGSTAELRTGEKVEVSSNTSEYFQRLVRIVLPLKLASSSKEEVIAYLKQADEQNERELELEKQALAEALGKKDEPESTAVPVTVKKKTDTVTTEEEFDLTQLTEEQRKSLALSTLKGRG